MSTDWRSRFDEVLRPAYAKRWTWGLDASGRIDGVFRVSRFRLWMER